MLAELILFFVLAGRADALACYANRHTSLFTPRPPLLPAPPTPPSSHPRLAGSNSAMESLARGINSFLHSVGLADALACYANRHASFLTPRPPLHPAPPIPPSSPPPLAGSNSAMESLARGINAFLHSAGLADALACYANRYPIPPRSCTHSHLFLFRPHPSLAGSSSAMESLARGINSFLHSAGLADALACYANRHPEIRTAYCTPGPPAGIFVPPAGISGPPAGTYLGAGEPGAAHTGGGPGDTAGVPGAGGDGGRFSCDWQALQRHWEDTGRGLGHRLGCDRPPAPPELPPSPLPPPAPPPSEEV
jgi:hypothetical protein